MVNRTRSPWFVCRRFNSDCSTFDDRAKIPVAVVAFETNRSRAVCVRCIEDEKEIAEGKGSQPLVLKVSFQLPYAFKPLNPGGKVLQRNMNVVEAHKSAN